MSLNLGRKKSNWAPIVREHRNYKGRVLRKLKDVRSRPHRSFKTKTKMNNLEELQMRKLSNTRKSSNLKKKLLKESTKERFKQKEIFFNRKEKCIVSTQGSLAPIFKHYITSGVNRFLRTESTLFYIRNSFYI